jgi:DtxR family Mn-dependent transcriptional regulator
MDPVRSGEIQPALSESLEDYLEAILRLERSALVARVSEIASVLGVSRPSVTRALKALAGRGLVEHKSYGYVTLTPLGRQMAAHVERRHLALKDFLVEVLHLSPDSAETAACRMEHALEPDVFERFAEFADFLKASDDFLADWARRSR